MRQLRRSLEYVPISDAAFSGWSHICRGFARRSRNREARVPLNNQEFSFARLRLSLNRYLSPHVVISDTGNSIRAFTRRFRLDEDREKRVSGIDRDINFNFPPSKVFEFSANFNFARKKKSRRVSSSFLCALLSTIKSLVNSSNSTTRHERREMKAKSHSWRLY